MPRSLKITLFKIEIKSLLIQTPKVTVSMEYGGVTKKLPNPRFVRNKEGSFYRESLTVVTEKLDSDVALSIFAVTGSHQKEIGCVRVLAEELEKEDGSSKTYRLGNNEFTLEFDALYNSEHTERMTTEESQNPSQDSFFEVDIDKQSLGRESVEVTEGKGKKPSSKEQTPERSRASFEKSERQSFQKQIPSLLKPKHLHSLINEPKRVQEGREGKEGRVSFSGAAGEPPSTQNLKIEESRKSSSKVSSPTKSRQMESSNPNDSSTHHNTDNQCHDHSHSNPEFRAMDYFHFLAVSVFCWFIGRLIKRF